jgi:hypothetical protein
MYCPSNHARETPSTMMISSNFQSVIVFFLAVGSEGILSRRFLS